jgi:hypothetical protein
VHRVHRVIECYGVIRVPCCISECTTDCSSPVYMHTAVSPSRIAGLECTWNYELLHYLQPTLHRTALDSITGSFVSVERGGSRL